MANKEKIVKGVQICSDYSIGCDECPYRNGASQGLQCSENLWSDILKFLDGIVYCKNCKCGHHVVNVVNGTVTVYRVFCNRTNTTHDPYWFCADGRKRESNA